MASLFFGLKKKFLSKQLDRINKTKETRLKALRKEESELNELKSLSEKIKKAKTSGLSKAQLKFLEEKALRKKKDIDEAKKIAKSFFKSAGKGVLAFAEAVDELSKEQAKPKKKVKVSKKKVKRKKIKRKKRTLKKRSRRR